MFISGEGRALLCDFGIATLLRNNVTVTGPSCLGGTVRWMAPELLRLLGALREHQSYSAAGDMWAFGMTVYVCAEGLLRELILTAS